MAVHEAKVKIDKKHRLEETPELLNTFKKNFSKEKISKMDDNAIQAEVDTLALKLAEDPANADAKVVLHDDIQALLKTKKKRVCWCCRTANCLIRQTISTKLKIRRKF